MNKIVTLAIQTMLMSRNILLIAALLCALVVASCNRVSKYPIDDPARIKIDNTLLGKWVMKEDTLKTNYFLITKKDDFRYNITYMNKGGTNRQYENFEAFISKINNVRFLNVQYYFGDTKGYFFLKLIDVSESGDDVTTATVIDSTMMDIPKPAEVRARVTRNVNNPAFFADTAHFFKLKGF